MCVCERLFLSDLRRACIDVLPRDQGALGQRPGPQRRIVVVVVAGWARVPQDSAAAAPPLGRHVLLGRSLLVRFSVRAIFIFISMSITFLKLARLWALSHHHHLFRAAARLSAATLSQAIDFGVAERRRPIGGLGGFVARLRPERDARRGAPRPQHRVQPGAAAELSRVERKIFLSQKQFKKYFKMRRVKRGGQSGRHARSVCESCNAPVPLSPSHVTDTHACRLVACLFRSRWAPTRTPWWSLAAARPSRSNSCAGSPPPTSSQVTSSKCSSRSSVNVEQLA